LNGSGDDHWQTWLERELQSRGRETRRAAFADVDHPHLAGVGHHCAATLIDWPDDGFDWVAHSLVRAVAAPRRRAGRLTAAGPRALVSPPSPRTTTAEIAPFFPPPLDVDTMRRSADGTVLVAGDADPYLPEGIAAAYGLPLKMATTVVSGRRAPQHRVGLRRVAGLLDWCGR